MLQQKITRQILTKPDVSDKVAAATEADAQSPTFGNYREELNDRHKRLKPIGVRKSLTTSDKKSIFCW